MNTPPNPLCKGEKGERRSGERGKEGRRQEKGGAEKGERRGGERRKEGRGKEKGGAGKGERMMLRGGR